MATMLVNPRRQIFAAARELMDAQGYAALTMRGVAGRSGVGLGTIYNYYENKQELVRDMLALRWTEFSKRQAKIAVMPHGIYVKLFRTCQEYRAFAGSVAENDAISETGTGGGYAARLADLVEEMLVEEAKRGSVRLKRPVRELANFIAMNFAAMCRMPEYHYELFEGVLKEILG